MTLRAASPLTSYLLEGLVIGLAFSLKGTTLATGGYREFKLRELLHPLAGSHAEFAVLLRQLYRLGPEVYLKRTLARLEAKE